MALLAIDPSDVDPAALEVLLRGSSPEPVRRLGTAALPQLRIALSDPDRWIASRAMEFYRELVARPRP